MSNSDSDKLAEEVVQAYAEFNMHLHQKGQFPINHFDTFFQAVVSYSDATKNEKMIHRKVARAVYGFREMLEMKSFCAPEKAIDDADRLESILFGGYDTYFEGDEPPGL